MTGTDTQPPDEQRPADGTGRPPLVEWQERLRASAGFRAFSLQTRVKRIGYLFQGNVAQYKALVAKLQDPAVSFPFFDMSHPEAHDDLLSEGERLLHNVLTAMTTRIDQQRAFMDKNFRDDPALTKEYLDRIATTFTASAETTFLKGLRNYITHDQLPVAQTKQTFGGGSYEITFTLPSQPLLTWSSWNATTKAWIAAQGEAVAIVNAVDTYAGLAGHFDKWLHDRIGQKHRTEIDAFLREQEEYTRAFDRVFGM